MKKINLLLLSTLFLTGCNHEPLFFTGKVATDEEVLNFFSNVNEGYALIPDGWYEYDFGDNETSIKTRLIFNIESYQNENNEWTYHVKELKGSTKTAHATTNYLSDGNCIIVETINNKDGSKIIKGSNSIKFSINNWIFNFANKINYTFYLKEYSVHIEHIIDVWIDHFGIKYSNDYKKIISSKMTRKIFINNQWGTRYSSIHSCEPIDIAIEQTYDEEITYLTKYPI